MCNQPGFVLRSSALKCAGVSQSALFAWGGPSSRYLPGGHSRRETGGGSTRNINTLSAPTQVIKNGTLNSTAKTASQAGPGNGSRGRRDRSFSVPAASSGAVR